MAAPAAAVEAPPPPPELPPELEPPLSLEADPDEELSDVLFDEAGEADEVVEDDVDEDELSELLVPPLFLFELPEYRSEYQPLPLRMKLPEVIWRFAAGF